jgi:hydroxymethylbilane synthase
MGVLRIGTRGSALALWQADHVRSRLTALGHEAEIRTITTTGDRLLDRRLEAVGGKGAFLKEIEEALLAREVDLAVHSLKDVPTTLPDGLHLAAYLERADPRDAVVARDGKTLAGLPPGATIGTTSLRRQAQIRALYPQLHLADLRGNVDTRLRRLREGHFDAILLAAAGMARLGRIHEATELLDPVQFLPAPGQGVVAIECRAGDQATAAAVAPLHHSPSTRCALAERAFLAALGGGCNLPLGAYAHADGDGLVLRAFVSHTDGSRMLGGERRGIEPADVGGQLAEELLARGAREIITAP